MTQDEEGTVGDESEAASRWPGRITGVGLADLLHLEPHGPDTFVGQGPRYPWGGLYGGQVLAQALTAATLTVDAPDARVHSLRTYFIHAGDHTQPVRYEVDRLRNGRSFTTRRVVARQAHGAILNLEASFARIGEEPDHSRSTMPDVPGPEAAPADPWTDLVDRRILPPVHGSGEVHAWLRITGPTGGADDAGFAFLSDDIPSEAARCLVIDPGADMAAFDREWFVVSLDHTIWFHVPSRPDEWHLHSFTCERQIGDRYLTMGRVHSAEGRHVATVAQEVLVRRRRGR